MQKKEKKINKCNLCKYIEGGGFPFICSQGKRGWDDLPKGFYIDSEGCYYLGKSKIPIKYCPSCGEKL